MHSDIRTKLLNNAYCELNNRDPSAYWRECIGQVPKKAYAWCGIFALYCLRKTGLCNWSWAIAPDKSGFLFRLPRTTDPQPGDVAYFDQPYQHHALVQSVDGDTLYLIQGNYGTPGHVAESTCSIKLKKPAFFSIDKLVCELEGNIV